ncbi:MAG: hypothetical protein WCT16_03515 [Candidatus Buchananbacteria bacterium]
MKEFFVLLVIAVMLFDSTWYIVQIHRRKISPALSTWIIFVLGTGLSLATYAIAEHHDFQSGVLNTMDTGVCIIILLTLVIGGERGLKFKPFEKWYLVGIGLVIVYGVLTGDAWSSNIFTQVLISIGYIPTVHNLIKEKRNTESFVTWTGGLLTGMLALYPSIVGGNILAAVYSIRTITLVSIMLLVMSYYQIKTTNTKESEGTND